MLEISIITNSKITAFSRAYMLYYNNLGKIKINVFSVLPIELLKLKRSNINSFKRIPNAINIEDYWNIAENKKFKESSICLLFYTKLVPSCLFKTKKLVNFHPSLLPLYSGLNGYIKAVNEGQLAFTCHRVSEGIDDGEILIQKEIKPFPLKVSDKKIALESSRLCSSLIIDLFKGKIHDNKKIYSSSKNAIKSSLIN